MSSRIDGLDGTNYAYFLYGGSWNLFRFISRFLETESIEWAVESALMVPG